MVCLQCGLSCVLLDLYWFDNICHTLCTCIYLYEYSCDDSDCFEISSISHIHYVNTNYLQCVFFCGTSNHFYSQIVCCCTLHTHMVLARHHVDVQWYHYCQLQSQSNFHLYMSQHDTTLQIIFTEQLPSDVLLHDYTGSNCNISIDVANLRVWNELQCTSLLQCSFEQETHREMRYPNWRNFAHVNLLAKFHHPSWNILGDKEGVPKYGWRIVHLIHDRGRILSALVGRVYVTSIMNVNLHAQTISEINREYWN